MLGLIKRRESLKILQVIGLKLEVRVLVFELLKLLVDKILGSFGAYT